MISIRQGILMLTIMSSMFLPKVGVCSEESWDVETAKSYILTGMAKAGFDEANCAIIWYTPEDGDSSSGWYNIGIWQEYLPYSKCIAFKAACSAFAAYASHCFKWRTKYLYISYNGQMWSVKTKDLRKAMPRERKWNKEDMEWLENQIIRIK